MQLVMSRAKEFLKDDGISLRDLTWFLGFVESLRPVIEVTPLHYRSLQRKKLAAERACLQDSTFLSLVVR